MPPASDKTRFEALRGILIRQRDEELLRIKELRRDQAEDALDGPGDEMEMARSLNDMEMHASLCERSEERLRAIEAAFVRLEHDRYGICSNCGEEISLPRLSALPFATLCVDCQQQRETRRASMQESDFAQNHGSQWRSVLSDEEPDDPGADDDEPATGIASAFAPEEGELEEPSIPPGRGRRRRRTLAHRV